MNLSESGKSALLQLAGGDMRRVLNLLQATHLSYEVVDEEVVYLTAGAAVPRVIEHMFNSLMNDSFLQAYNTINQVSHLVNFLCINDIIYATLSYYTNIYFSQHTISNIHRGFLIMDMLSAI